LQKKNARYIEKFAIKEIDPAKVLTSLENAVKDITFFLITPRHIASALRLILSLFGLYLPVYISLEVLQFLGITDIIIEMYGGNRGKIKKNYSPFSSE
jgi:hypothetical protein